MRRAIKILVYVGAFSALVLVVMGFRGSSATRAIYEDTFRLLGALPESVDVAEGARLTTINGCRDCHGEDLAGRVFIDAPPFLVVAPNLTTGAGGVAAAYRTAADWDRAIRYRIRPDGRGLLPMMPSENYHYMSDEDLAGIIAYLRSAPPIDNELPETKVRLMGLPIAGAGVLHPAKEQRDAPGGPTPARAATAGYGSYLASLTCIECHGGDLTGGPTPGGGPKAPALAISGRWSLDAFQKALREGVAPGGRRLAEEMPSSYFAHMTDVEIEALHKHLATLPLEQP